MEIHIPENDPDLGKRLDLYLSLKLPSLSRSQIKKVIESNKVLINNKLCFKAGYKIQGGEKITLPELEIQEHNFTKLKKSKFDLEILFEDKDYIFINKPTGLTVHPTSPTQSDTLVNKLLDLYSDLPQNDFLRPGIVHRLDKETSGVIVVARNPKSLWWISNQFASRKVSKEYASIGINFDNRFHHNSGDKFVVEGYMNRNVSNRKMFSIDLKDETYGKYSKSEFEIIEKVNLNNYLLIFSTIKPTTGRTHQIRVHQKSKNFTIIGDSIYLSKKQIPISLEILSDLNVKNRLYLHAKKLTFENYDGKLYSVESQLPQDFVNLLTNAKAKPTLKNQL